MGRYVYIKNKKTKAGQLGHWPETKRIEVVTTFLSTGSPSETCQLTGVPFETFKAWRKSEWFKEMVKTMQSDDDAKIDAKLSKIIDRTLEKLLDSVENGEHVYDQKTGKIKRMPAKLRDINNAFNTVLDKRQLIRKQPTKIVEQHNTAEQLQNLAASFAKFVQQPTTSKPEIPFIEGDTVVQNEDGTWEIKEN